MTEADLMALTAKRYPEPEWAFLRQVRNSTGYRRTERYADGLALNCYPSRGLELHGFEAKSSRSDWTRELKNPDKSCAIQTYCDRWWIVAPPDVVRLVELPPTWGLLEVSGKKRLKLVCKTEAPKLEDPKPLDRGFVASTLRNAARATAGADLLEAAKREGRAEAQDVWNKRAEQERVRAGQRHENLANQIREFEEASGLKLTPWESGKIGEAVAAIRAAGATATRVALAGQLDQLRRCSAQVEAALAELAED